MSLCFSLFVIMQWQAQVLIGTRHFAPQCLSIERSLAYSVSPL